MHKDGLQKEAIKTSKNGIKTNKINHRFIIGGIWKPAISYRLSTPSHLLTPIHRSARQRAFQSNSKQHCACCKKGGNMRDDSLFQIFNGSNPYLITSYFSSSTFPNNKITNKSLWRHTLSPHKYGFIVVLFFDKNKDKKRTKCGVGKAQMVCWEPILLSVHWK